MPEAAHPEGFSGRRCDVEQNSRFQEMGLCSHVVAPGQVAVIALMAVTVVLLAGCGHRSPARSEAMQAKTPNSSGPAPSGPVEEPPQPTQQLETKVLDLGNGVTMKLVRIPAGEFMMGSPDSAKWHRDNEGPQHRVRITKPFYMGMTEVTVGQFGRFVDATGYKTDPERDDGAIGWTSHVGVKSPEFNWHNPGIKQGPDYPVTCVSWNDAQAFCRWLGKEAKLDGRLPTEAEWEYACRAGTTTRFPWGDSEEAAGQYANVADKTYLQKFAGAGVSADQCFDTNDGYVFAAPVASYKPNAWGLYDMIGNVTEWCSDWSGSYSSSPQDDPQGPPSGLGRVLRDPGWACAPSLGSCAFRMVGGPKDAIFCIGFRVVLAAQ